MLKLYLKENHFSWRDTFYIKNEYGTDLFSVRGTMFSLKKKLAIFDDQENQVAMLQSSPILIVPRYKIYVSGESVMTIRNQLSFFQKYSIEGFPWELSGNFAGFRFMLQDENGAMLMQFSKELGVWGNHYVLTIYQTQYLLQCLCIALAVQASRTAIDKFQRE